MSETENIRCDVLIIGAGVIGLAVAAGLSGESLSVCLVEAHDGFGRETSSRNSEVVHSGIYYPAASAKTRWCIEGREALYAFCEKYSVPCRRLGKIVVATEPAEEEYLERLAEHCKALEVPYDWWGAELVRASEPLVKASCALLLPESGIVDSHQLMAALERRFLEGQGTIVYRHRVSHLEKRGSDWRVELESAGGRVQIDARTVVNAAGLAAAELSNRCLQTTRYEQRYCRGRYFTLAASYRGKFSRLVYPVPPKDGLGIHVTLDLDGYVRLGPDVDWCPGIGYTGMEALYECDWESLREPFARAVRRYCPSVQADSLAPALIGVRPKLFVDGVAYPDFLVEAHEGFIHCLGIESPGLTASLPIAAEVKRLQRKS